MTDVDLTVDAIGKLSPSQLVALLDTLDPAAAGRASRDQLADVLTRPELRDHILAEIFRRRQAHLRPDRAAKPALPA